MALPANFGPAQRPELHVFYVLDTSGSMDGNPIGVLNRAMVATVDALKQVAAHNSNAKVKIAVLEFNTTCQWVQPAGPEDMEYFVWDPLTAQGMTYVGAALDELDSKLHRSQFLASSTGAFLPVIIFMTDGFANDDYTSALKRIRKNEWFSKATRVGFAIGKNPDVSMIAKLTGDTEAVIRTDDLGLFATMLKFVSTSSVNIASRSYTADAQVSGGNAVRAAAVEAGVNREQFDPGFIYQEPRMVPDAMLQDYGVAGGQVPGTVLVDSADFSGRSL